MTAKSVRRGSFVAACASVLSFIACMLPGPETAKALMLINTVWMYLAHVALLGLAAIVENLPSEQALMLKRRIDQEASARRPTT